MFAWHFAKREGGLQIADCCTCFISWARAHPGIALLMLFMLRLTSLESDFLAFGFLTFLPNAKDLKAEKTAQFLLESDHLTCSSPSEMLVASALNAFTSFFLMVFIVKNLLCSWALDYCYNNCCFFHGVTRRAAFTISVLRFLEVLFLYLSPQGFSSSGSCSFCFPS